MSNTTKLEHNTSKN